MFHKTFSDHFKPKITSTAIGHNVGRSPVDKSSSANFTDNLHSRTLDLRNESFPDLTPVDQSSSLNLTDGINSRSIDLRDQQSPLSPANPNSSLNASRARTSLPPRTVTRKSEVRSTSTNQMGGTQNITKTVFLQTVDKRSPPRHAQPEGIEYQPPPPTPSETQANISLLARQNREIAYGDVTSPESSFDDEVPTSEQDEIPGYNDADFLRSDDPNFRRPMSTMKLELFKDLAKSELKPGNATVPEAEMAQKRLNLIRRFHARRTKKHRSNATVRLLNMMADPRKIVIDPTQLDIEMHWPEIMDKKLIDKTSYYNEKEPEKYVSNQSTLGFM